jgi:hypothetical protein
MGLIEHFPAGFGSKRRNQKNVSEISSAFGRGLPGVTHPHERSPWDIARDPNSALGTANDERVRCLRTLRNVAPAARHDGCRATPHVPRHRSAGQHVGLHRHSVVHVVASVSGSWLTEKLSDARSRHQRSSVGTPPGVDSVRRQRMVRTVSLAHVSRGHGLSCVVTERREAPLVAVPSGHEWVKWTSDAVLHLVKIAIPRRRSVPTASRRSPNAIATCAPGNCTHQANTRCPCH